MTNKHEEYLNHYGVKGMKWGVRKQYEPKGNRSARILKDNESKFRAKVRETSYAVASKINPRELKYSVKRATTIHRDADEEYEKLIYNSMKESGTVPTNQKLLDVLNRQGIKRHKEAKYDNIDDSDIQRFKKYTDAAVYSRTINTYLATGQPEHVSQKAKELKDSIGKNQISNQVVFRSTNLKFSTNGLGKKLDALGEEELRKSFESFNRNFKGKSFKENRIYSTSTSPEFAIDTWRKVNPNAAKTYNAYMIIDCKGTPGVLADGRTKSGNKLVNTRSNQEAILAPNKMTYERLTWDKDRQMFAIYMRAE